jgi:lysozyme
MSRQISSAARGRLKKLEGLSLSAYDDGVGVLTIGYGHTGDVKLFDKLTEAQADQLLMKDLARFESGVANLVSAETDDPQFDAMVLLAFNIGLAAFARSTVLKAHNRGDYDSAARAFALWNKAGGRVMRGLVRRRAEEAALYLSSYACDRSRYGAELDRVWAATQQPTPDIKGVDAPLIQSRTMQGGAVVTGATAITALSTASQMTSDASTAYQNVSALGIPIIWIAAGAAAATLIGVAYMLWARWDDKRKGFK